MTQPQRPRQVVVAYDFSPSADHALELAIETALYEPLHVFHLVAAIDPQHGLPIAPVSGADYEYAELIQRKMEERLAEVLAGRDARHEIHFFVHARIGAPAPEILHLAEEVGADLVLIGSHGRKGAERLVLGSVSERVVREARCPVLVARARSYVDVDLLQVVPTDHPPHRYVKPHRYSYVDRRVLTRPHDWPLS